LKDRSGNTYYQEKKYTKGALIPRKKKKVNLQGRIAERLWKDSAINRKRKKEN